MQYCGLASALLWQKNANFPDGGNGVRSFSSESLPSGNRSRRNYWCRNDKLMQMDFFR